MRETITFRPRRTKRQLQEAFGNVSEKLNELVERELSHSPPPDWREVLSGGTGGHGPEELTSYASDPSLSLCRGRTGTGLF